jgi:Rap1a immunity proteins
MRSLFAAIALLGLSASASAGNPTDAEIARNDGTLWLKACTSEPAEFWKGTCIGLIIGADETHRFITTLTKMPMYCMPLRGITNGQKLAIFVKFLQDHPEELHVPGPWLFLMAMRTAFPCPKNSVQK